MPTITVRSGPDIVGKHGERKTPQAMVHYCEDCGYEGAAFGVHKDGVLRSYCGWRDGDAMCVGKAQQVVA